MAKCTYLNFHLLLVSMVLFIAGMAQKHFIFSEYDEPDSVIMSRLWCPFVIKEGYLAIVVTRESQVRPFPKEYLCYLSKGHVTRIRHLSHLKGLVKITTPAEALSFVRLSTSFKTKKLFPPESYELFRQRDFSLSMVYGDKEYYKFMMQGLSWYKKEKSVALNSNLNFVRDPSTELFEDTFISGRLDKVIYPAICKSTATGFEIKRTLVQPLDADNIRLLFVVEKVTSSGGYTRKIQSIKLLSKSQDEKGFANHMR